MGKGNYFGGGTLIGCGPISKTKNGGKSGLGSGAALREQRRLALRKKRLETAAKIKKNEILLGHIAKDLVAAKRRTHNEQVVAEHRIKVSPLAQALRRALEAQPKSR